MLVNSLGLDEQVAVVLRRISQAIELWSREMQRQFGLTAPQLAVLREVAAGENLSPTTIGEALHLSQPTVTGILQRLEDAGLISREKSTVDRRSVIATVTDAGQAMLAKAPPLLRDRFREQLDELPDYRQSEILSSLQLVAHMLQPLEDNADLSAVQNGTASAPGKRRSRGATLAAAASGNGLAARNGRADGLAKPPR
jgi:DNA-binding MarR family transcriptional regulator